MTVSEQIPLADIREAAALKCVVPGVDIRPVVKEHTDTGRRVVDYFLHGPGLAAAAMLRAQERHGDPKKNLARAAPEHPYLAARHALEAQAALELWLDGKTETPRLLRTRGRLWRLAVPSAATRAEDAFPAPWSGERRPDRALRAADTARAAAAIVCGFPVWPALCRGRDGAPVWAFRGESDTFPGLLWRHLEELARPVRSEPLPNGFPPGEHPLEYALQAALNRDLLLLSLRRRAEKNPAYWIPGRAGRRALVSRSVIEKKDSAARDRLRHFLKL